MTKKNEHTAGDHSKLPNFSEGRYGGSSSPPIESLPILGTTWYRRGYSYWARRVGIFFLMLFLVACQILFVWVIFHVISSDTKKSFAFRTVALAIVSIVVLGGFIYWVRWFARVEKRKRRGEIAYPDYKPRGATGGMLAGGAGNLARSGDTTAGGCAFAASILTAGSAPFLILQSLQKEYTYEHDARIRLEQWKEKHSTST